MPFPQVGQTIYGGWSQEGEQYADLKTRFSSFNTKLSGLVSDGVADDRTLLNTLANVTMQPSGGTLDVVGTIRIGSNLTIPANVTLRFLAGAKLAPDVGATVTINGPIFAPTVQIFAGAGGFSFGIAAAREVPAQWFGIVTDNATNNDATVQIAVNALQGTGIPLSLPQGCRYTAAVIWKGVRYVSQQAPFLIGSTAIPAGSTNAGMTSDGGYLYVCEYTNGKLAVLDIADRRNPKHLSSTAVGANPRNIQIVGSYIAIVCLGDNAVKFYDRTAVTPSLAFTVATRATPKDLVIVNDRYMYVVCNSGWVQKFEIDWANLTAYLVKETPTVGGTPLHVSHYNGVLYVVGSSPIVDVFNTSALARIGGYEILTSTANSCSVPIGRYLYVVSAGALDKLYVLDIKDPTVPALVTSIAVSNEPAWITQSGKYLFVSSLTPVGVPGAIDMIDITDPANPVLIKTVQCSAVGTCFSTIVDNFLYVAGHDAPFNVDVLELPPSQVTRTALSVPNDPEARKPRKYITTVVDYALLATDDVIRVGLGKTITLPDPSTVPLGKVYAIVNVSSTLNAAVANAFLGYSGKIAPLGAVSVVPTLFGGNYQWERIAGDNTTALVITAWTIAWTIDCFTGDAQELTGSVAATGYAINAPINPRPGQLLEITVKNTSGGALGAGTFNAIFKLGAAWANPANGFSRSITFRYNGANWVEKGRTAVDVAN